MTVAPAPPIQVLTRSHIDSWHRILVRTGSAEVR
jgi:hypothetical protein